MKTINIKECTIKKIDTLTLAESFIKKYHTQGWAKCKIAYGIFHNNELIQVMTFGIPRFNKYYQWEIIRECTKTNTKIPRGISALWKQFIKENSCHSCISYHYPQNGKYVNFLVDYCGFKCIQKCKPTEKTTFIGTWNGKEKRIDKSLLERHGVDRLLRRSFGNGSNEELIQQQGFKKVKEKGLNPQIDIYYPFGLVYKIIDLTDNTYYIGLCQCAQTWNNGYLGSGKRWSNHLQTHPDHKYKRVILKKDFKTPKECIQFEATIINTHINDPKCYNLTSREQGNYISSVCKECGAKQGKHKETCSHFNKKNKCPECGGLYGSHKSTCQHYKEGGVCPECGYSDKSHQHAKTCSHYKQATPCPECGALYGHYKTCPQYTDVEACPECGKKYGHKSTCSKFKFTRKKKPCPECGAIVGHKKGCKLDKNICAECGGVNGKHKKGCNKYKTPKTCPKCGGKQGHHKKGCELNKNVCPHCGTPKGGKHSKDCPNYKEIICPECGYKNNRHNATCSHAKKCTECGGKAGRHTPTCSKYKKRVTRKVTNKQKGENND